MPRYSRVCRITVLLTVAWGAFWHASAKRLVFPHVVSGDGVSMQISITNLSAAPAVGQMRLLDSNGNAQQFPGIDAVVELELAPHETWIAASSGGSDPLKTGYIEVDLDQEAVSGLVILRYASGLETGISPAPLTDKASFAIERSLALDTGIAVLLTDLAPLRIRLFDQAGNLQAFNDNFQVPERRFARFFDELFEDELVEGLPEEFLGSIELESDSQFALIGLRFGEQALTSIPIQVLAEPNAGFKVDTASILVRSLSAETVSVTGTIENLDVSDAAFTTVAVRALGSDGRLAGGGLASVIGSNRRVAGSVFSHAVLQPGEFGYFDVAFDVSQPGQCCEIELFVLADVQDTETASGRPEVVDSQLADDGTGRAVVTGTIRNNGEVGIDRLRLATVFFQSAGLVLAIELSLPDEPRLEAGQETSFVVRTAVELAAVGSLAFRMEWADDDGQQEPIALTKKQTIIANLADGDSRLPLIRIKALSQNPLGRR